MFVSSQNKMHDRLLVILDVCVRVRVCVCACAVAGDIAGPLPRSWMKAQHSLQKQILARTRSLGMVGQLPAFQAAVPSELKYKLDDKNATDNMQGTAWLDSLDPLFLEIASKWMKTMIDDFGTDHWYQLDGYFNGGTAPWYTNDEESALDGAAPPLPPKPPGYWSKRGEKAWASLSNSDPDAIWSYQGWAILNAKGSSDMMAGFVGAVRRPDLPIVQNSCTSSKLFQC